MIEISKDTFYIMLLITQDLIDGLGVQLRDVRLVNRDLRKTLLELKSIA